MMFPFNLCVIVKMTLLTNTSNATFWYETKAYSEACEASKMERIAKIVNGC